MRTLGTLLAAVFLFTTSTHALAQEMEPNESCLTAQDAGVASVTFSISGALQERDENTRNDIDFFRFTGTRGTFLTATVESPILFGPRVGLFDEACRLVADSGGESVLDFTVPANGAFTVAIADASDRSFDGLGAANPGPYTLSFGPQPPFIGSIAGRLVDARSSEPLAASILVSLDRCLGESCESAALTQTGARGRFRFEMNAFGRRFPAGTFRLRAFAFERPITTSVRFQVSENEHALFGDFGIPLLPILAANVEPCVTPDATATLCRYSLDLRNTTDETLSGIARSVVFGDFPVLFETSTADGPDVKRARFTLPPLGSTRVTFSFDVPAFVPEGAFFCAELHVGLDPTALVVPIVDQRLFCFAKQSPAERQELPLANASARGLVVQDIQRCAPLGPEGGTCEYSVTIQNDTASEMTGQLHSPVWDFFAPRFFEASTTRGGDGTDVVRARLSIPPHDSRTVTFYVDVPAEAPNDTILCPSIRFGLDPSPLVNSVREESLFCFGKGNPGPGARVQ